MRPKIKKVKDFIIEGAAQFEVLMRKEYKNGQVAIYMEVLPTGDIFDFEKKTITKSFKEAKPIQAKHELNLPLEGGTAIKKVKRIVDGEVFYCNQQIRLENSEHEYFIVEFKEDLVKCIVYDLTEVKPHEIEVNSIKRIELDIDFEEDEEEVSEREEGWFNT